MSKIIFTINLALFIVIFSSCKKDSNSADSSYSYAVRLTDDPGPYDAVYIDLKAVEIVSGSGKTITLNVHNRIYNLLNFSNGTDTLIAFGTCTDEKVEQIRLILGPNNSIVADGISYPLSTPSAEQSGLKLQVHQVLSAHIGYEVLLDFDANKSIVKTGNGSYKLKPVIRTIEKALTGLIKGNITPAGISATVSATSNDTWYSNVTSSGNFMVMGLYPGIYSVTVTPAPPKSPFIKENVSVVAGQTTDIGTISL